MDAKKLLSRMAVKQQRWELLMHSKAAPEVQDEAQAEEESRAESWARSLGLRVSVSVDFPGAACFPCATGRDGLVWIVGDPGMPWDSYRLLSLILIDLHWIKISYLPCAETVMTLFFRAPAYLKSQYLISQSIGGWISDGGAAGHTFLALFWLRQVECRHSGQHRGCGIAHWRCGCAYGPIKSNKRMFQSYFYLFPPMFVFAVGIQNLRGLKKGQELAAWTVPENPVEIRWDRFGHELLLHGPAYTFWKGTAN